MNRRRSYSNSTHSSSARFPSVMEHHVRRFGHNFDGRRYTPEPRPSVEAYQRVSDLNIQNRQRAVDAARRQNEKIANFERERKRKEERLNPVPWRAVSVHGHAWDASKDQHTSQKRTSAQAHASISPHTYTVVEPNPPKRRSTTAMCRMAWKEDGAFGPGIEDRASFTDIALQDGNLSIYQPPLTLSACAFRDGITIILSDDGVFQTATGGCKWHLNYPWSEFASKLKCAENARTMKLDITSDDGLGVKRVGAGTFNIVINTVPEIVPEWLKDKDVVYRITRPDIDHEGENKYQTIGQMAGEADNAMFASANNIGVTVYSIASYAGMRHGRTLRYGTVYALLRADMDLFRALENCQSFDGGALIAVQVSELLFQVSRCSVAFFDIKPANILRMENSGGTGGYFRLTDYDPAFFIRLQDQDWRTLLLLNLALLAAHVRNQEFSSSKGFIASARPLLRQLIKRHKEFKNVEWLFNVRSVRVNFEVIGNHGTFQLQRMFAVMATSYFYGKNVKTPSSKYKWETKDQQILDVYWKLPKNRHSWPSNWTSEFKPLIEQLVDFALA